MKGYGLSALSCWSRTGKRKADYPTKAAAVAWLERNHQTEHQKPFHCPMCGLWHVTTKPRGERP